ncbi:MarR family transcriptional regulator [Streptomyces sp. NPDC020951]|uniref:MarR family transcriptional regulator n=1 Tax=Streptomyces sp. NPDC020951 TaxID=3365104 RepID=UPI0037B8C6BD
MSGYELLARDLAACSREGFTGELRVFGAPGGAFHLYGGLVVAVESPGAPAPEALLLRSGRIGGEEWAGLVRESGGARWPAAGLIAHGYAGAAQLRVVCAMALQDAAFAVVAGSVDGCERGPAAGPPPAAVAVGEPPTRLLQEASRKLAALLALPCPVRPDRERPVPASLSYAAARLGALQCELLAHADGRRTARDLAFRTGRGVYTVTVEVARMVGEGLLECVDAPRPIPVRLPPDGHGVRPREPAPPALPPPQPVPEEPTALPRRRPGASGINEALTPEQDEAGNGTGWKEFFRLRNSPAK